MCLVGPFFFFPCARIVARSVFGWRVLFNFFFVFCVFLLTLIALYASMSLTEQDKDIKHRT